MQQLPNEIVEDILVRLQVVDLLRFKSVCNLWYRVISDTRFIRRHLEHSKANPSHHRILTPNRNSSMETIDCSDLYDGEVVTADLPLPFKSEVTFLGTCDGLVCCLNNRNRRIFAWNPATRMCKSLKTLNKSDRLDRERISFYWFGHESDDDVEYKLVIGSMIGKNLIHLINLYAADEDEWKSTLELGKLYLQIEAGTLYNRRVHWAACHISSDNIGGFVIVSFDLRSRTVIEIPGREGTVMLEFATMCVINGCLSAIHRTLHENSKPIFEVWTMKEYGVKESWSKLTTILSDVDTRPYRNVYSPFLSVVAVTGKGDLIVIVEETEVMVCNIGEGKSRKLTTNEKGREGRGSMYVVESLVFPSGVPIMGSLAR